MAWQKQPGKAGLVQQVFPQQTLWLLHARAQQPPLTLGTHQGLLHTAAAAQLYELCYKNG